MVNRLRSPGGSSKLQADRLKRNPSSAHPSKASQRARTRYLWVLLLLILLGAGAFLLYSQSEEKRVKKLFRQLSEAISKESGESLFTLDQKLKTIGSLFDEDCEIHIPAYSIAGRLTREEITSYAARSRLHLSELRLTFYDFRITFPQTEAGKVDTTARLTGKLTTGEAINEAHEIVCLLKKDKKRWLLTKVEVVEVLKK